MKYHFSLFILICLTNPALAHGSDTLETVKNEPSVPVTISVSLGASYLSFHQQFSAGTNRQLEFESLNLPFLDIHLKVDFSDRSKFTFNFLRYSPSSTDSNPTTQVAQKTMNIRTSGGEYHYTLLATENSRFRWDAFIGLRSSSFPLLIRSSPSTVEATMITYYLFSAGSVASFKIKDRWTLETLVRYLSPLSSASTYQISSTLLLDIEADLLYHFEHEWALGLGLNTQLQQYSIASSTLDVVTSQSFRATQDNMLSALYLKVSKTW